VRNGNIFNKNREISILPIKKKHSQVNTSSRSHRKIQTRKDKNKQKTAYEQKCPVDHPVSFLVNIYDPSCTNYLV
jgi:hypothetical protein